MRKNKQIIILIVSVWPVFSVACPNLTSYYPDMRSEEIAWKQVSDRLAEIYDQCLLSTEYFALFGAAQLNSGQLSKAIESLERALLLDPNNGAALFDYADVLLKDGQLFAAIEINELLITRQDVPPELKSQITQRHQQWTALTKQTRWQLDMVGGYDNNLNGAPDDQILALTLSGDSIFLALNEEFQAVGGPFLNGRILGQHQRLAPGIQHSFVGQIRSRYSEDSKSDVAQVVGRYDRVEAIGGASWLLGIGLNHLNFVGQPVFTGIDVRSRRQLGGSRMCRPYLAGALQHQAWHQQRRLDGIEVKASFGASCPLSGVSRQQLSVEGSLLHNAELNNDRLGGDRDGWQMSLEWQMDFLGGLISAELNHTRLLDGSGFSSLLKNNARREIERSSALLQYRETLDWAPANTQFVVNLFHQMQQSNITLFETKDTSLEIGLSWRF